jgi:hypothetical protein
MLAQNLNDIQTKAGFTFGQKSLDDVTLVGFITDGLPYIFGAAGIILLFNIISSGIKMMTSAGAPKVMQASQAKITTSLIGILVLFGSFWIVTLILQFLGINLDNPFIAQ